MFFASGPLESALTISAMGVEIPAERQRSFGFGTLETALDAIEGAVSNTPYLTGAFSAADVYVGSQIGFFMQFGMMEKRPAFEDYVARLQARPAFIRAGELDDKLAAEMQGS